MSRETVPEMAKLHPQKHLMVVVAIFLSFSILLKFFPPKKPNPYFGYQLGNAKKSLAHWRLANTIAANYWIMLNALALAILAIDEYTDFNGRSIALIVFLSGNVLIYRLIQVKLKAIEK